MKLLIPFLSFFFLSYSFSYQEKGEDKLNKTMLKMIQAVQNATPLWQTYNIDPEKAELIELDLKNNEHCKLINSSPQKVTQQVLENCFNVVFGFDLRALLSAAEVGDELKFKHILDGFYVHWEITSPRHVNLILNDILN